MPDLDRDTIRELRVLVLLAELDVGARDVDLAVLRDDPLVDRVERITGVDEVLTDFQTLGLLGDVALPVVGLLGQRLRVAWVLTLKEVPAVGTLLGGGDVSQHRCVVLARNDLESGSRLDYHGELATIPCPVVVGADLEAQLVVALNLECIEVEVEHGIVAVAALDLDLLGEQLLAVEPDLERDAIR